MLEHNTLIDNVVVIVEDMRPPLSHTRKESRCHDDHAMIPRNLRGFISNKQHGGNLCHRFLVSSVGMSSPSGIQVCAGQCRTDTWQNLRGRRWHSGPSGREGGLLLIQERQQKSGCHEAHMRPHKNHGQVQAQVRRKQVPLATSEGECHAQCFFFLAGARTVPNVQCPMSFSFIKL